MPAMPRRAPIPSLGLVLATALSAQVHYHDDGRPWNQRAKHGPDKDVPGWYYNLGVTGLRVELVADAPTHLVVRYVFDGSPAAKHGKRGDHIVGAGGAMFTTPHRNGYGMDVFGPHGPVLDFANALESALAGDGRLQVSLQRDGRIVDAQLQLGTKHGNYGPAFPADCAKSERLLAGLLEYLAGEQRPDGSWGSPPRDTFAPLALLASGERRYAKAIEKAARFHARTTEAEDRSSLINWECADGTFYYQPNRDNAGYGADSRLKTSAVVALIFSIPKRSLCLTGKPFGENR